jgi:hypothetical protein
MQTAIAVVLGLDAAAYGVFGVRWLVDPAGMAGPLGISLANADATSDARAVYGGLELGLAVLLVICAARRDLRTFGLLAATCTLGGLGVCRLIGVGVDPAITGATWQLLATDVLGIAMNGALLVAALRAAPAP